MGNYFGQSGQRESSLDQFCTVRMSVFHASENSVQKKRNNKTEII